MDTSKFLTCLLCKKMFTKPFDLEQHERSHTGDRPFICYLCNRGFTQKSNLNTHLTTHKSWPLSIKTLNLKKGIAALNEYSCQFCEISFTTYLKLKHHFSEHTNLKVFRCPRSECDEIFTTTNLFLVHIFKHQTTATLCSRCGGLVSGFADDHHCQEENEQTRELRCKICKVKFKRLSSLRHHEALESHEHSCPECGANFTIERFLRRHLQTHVSGIVCPNSQSKSNREAQEDGSLSENLKTFVCDFCSASFFNISGLKTHIYKHLHTSFNLKSVVSKETSQPERPRELHVEIIHLVT